MAVEVPSLVAKPSRQAPHGLAGLADADFRLLVRVAHLQRHEHRPSCREDSRQPAD